MAYGSGSGDKMMKAKPKAKMMMKPKTSSKKMSGNKLKKLTEVQKTKLKKHEVNHSKKHNNMMRLLMRKGKSFSEAHKESLKKVGK